MFEIIFTVYWFLLFFILTDVIFEKPLTLAFPNFRADFLVSLISGVGGSWLCFTLVNIPPSEHGFNGGWFVTILITIILTVFSFMVLLDNSFGSLMCLRKRVKLADGKAYLSSKLLNRKEAAWFTNYKRTKKVKDVTADYIMSNKPKKVNYDYGEIVLSCKRGSFSDGTLMLELQVRNQVQKSFNDEKGYTFND